jgi:hypothetical protein
LSFRKAVCAAAPETVVLIALMSALAMLSNCTANFSTLVADHPECAVNAGIERWKVEQCLGYGNVPRDAFYMCLARQQVPQHKIETLDNCVAARSG